MNTHLLLHVTQKNLPEEIRSWKDLLQPRWKGKILIGRDPRVSGYGQSTFNFFYIHKDLGSEFICNLVRQDLKMLRDDRQAARWLGQGHIRSASGVTFRRTGSSKKAFRSKLLMRAS